MSSWTNNRIRYKIPNKPIVPIHHKPIVSPTIYSIDTTITFIIIANDNINNIVKNLLEQTDTNWICIIIKLSNNYDSILHTLNNNFKIIDCTNDSSTQDMSFYLNYATHFVYTDYLVYIDSNTIIQPFIVLRLREMIRLNPNIDAFFFKSKDMVYQAINNIVCYKLFNFYSNLKYKSDNFQSYLIHNGLRTLNI
jgi:hypothetical protein